MKQRHFWLLALLSILIFMSTTTLAIAEATTSGHVEIGVSAMDTEDSPARVNEYTKTSDEDNNNVNPALDLGIDYYESGIAAEVEADFEGENNFDFSIKADIKRIFKFNLDYQALEHQLDHENLGQMGATMRGDIGGSQPSVTTDQTYADVYEANGGVPIAIGGGSLSYDPALAVAQEMDNDYIITRRELKNEASLTLPSLPNVTFHAGLRIEEREGLKQAIGVTKCDSCHVSAVGKEINERTEDWTLGATGKFGKLTVEYEYQNRIFDEDGATPLRYYEPANNPSGEAQLLYGADSDSATGSYLEFNRTPDSEKDSHFLKGRYDFTRNTILSASYTKADIKSDKSEPASDISYDLADDTLKTEFESFGGKLSTQIAGIRLSVRANTYSIDAEDNTVELRDDVTTRDDSDLLSFSLNHDLHSAEERDVTEFGLDAVYRITRGTTLRLGYEYEEVEREEEELGETETNTFKIALKSRINKQLSGRVSYEYQDIDDPFYAHNATGIAQGIGETDSAYPGLAWLWTENYLSEENNSATAVWYWNSVYPNRTMDATNQPDEVQEGKLSATWAPSTQLAATLFARVRMEENSAVGYKQDSYVPGVSVYYAPTDKMNLTMAYTFNKQETENNMCVGWYHG